MTQSLRRPIETTTVVSVDAAAQVSEFIERMVDTHAPRQFRAEWQAVANALYALSNDTDAIITDDLVIKTEGGPMPTFIAIDGSTVTPTTRANLMLHPAFSDLAADDSGNPCVWENHYDSGAATWKDTWSCQCDDDGYAPYDSLWLARCTAWHEDGSPADAAYRLWETLPEA